MEISAVYEEIAAAERCQGVIYITNREPSGIEMQQASSMGMRRIRAVNASVGS